MTKARIIIATPSLIDQSRLEKSLVQSGAFDVVAQTADLSATYSKVEELMPDYVIIAEGFTRLGEYQCMTSLFRAVEAKTITLISSLGAAEHLNDLASGAAVIHSKMEPRDLARVLNDVPKMPSIPPSRVPPVVASKVAHSSFRADKIILIGASTGGIDALTTILGHFPSDCPPTAIVQHTGQNFSETLARLLDRRCAAEVVMAETGVEMKPGRVCLAGGIDGHLHLERRSVLQCNVKRGPATSGHIPSIDEMFLSCLPIAEHVVAALLTGMGRDGATGLLRLRQAGGTTFGQDEESSVVYGMPRVAHELGAVQRQLSLHEIGPAILQTCTQQQFGVGKVGT